MTKDKIEELIICKPGTVMPCEYNWQEQFAFDEEISPFVQMDVGKVRGLAIALQSQQKRIEELEEIIEDHKDLITYRGACQ